MSQPPIHKRPPHYRNTTLLPCRVCYMDFYERDFPGDILFFPALAQRWQRFCDLNQNDPGFSPFVFDAWLAFQQRKWRNYCSSCWTAIEEDHSITLDLLLRQQSF